VDDVTASLLEHLMADRKRRAWVDSITIVALLVIVAGQVGVAVRLPTPVGEVETTQASKVTRYPDGAIVCSGQPTTCARALEDYGVGQ